MSRFFGVTMLAIVAVYALACLGLFLGQRSFIYYPPPAAAYPVPVTTALAVPGAVLRISERPQAGKSALIYLGGNAEDVTAENPDEFKALVKYSPLHNLKPGTCYPATMITTADHDDRVVPAHSFKFAATAQAAQAGGNPVIIRIDTKAGHGAGKPTSKQIEEVADRWGFLTKALKMEQAPAAMGGAE